MMNLLSSILPTGIAPDVSLDVNMDKENTEASSNQHLPQGDDSKGKDAKMDKKLSFKDAERIVEAAMDSGVKFPESWEQDQIKEKVADIIMVGIFR
jgi:hypothetical protein